MDLLADADDVNQPNHASTIRTGKLFVNSATRRVTVDGQPVHLTDKEYGVLELLSLRKGATSTKEMFLDHLYQGGHEPEPEIVHVFVCKLRKKLAQLSGGSHYIDTVWGLGYVLRDPGDAPMTAALTPKSAVIDDLKFHGKDVEDCTG